MKLTKKKDDEEAYIFASSRTFKLSIFPFSPLVCVFLSLSLSLLSFSSLFSSSTSFFIPFQPASTVLQYLLFYMNPVATFYITFPSTYHCQWQSQYLSSNLYIYIIFSRVTVFRRTKQRTHREDSGLFWSDSFWIFVPFFLLMKDSE